MDNNKYLLSVCIATYNRKDILKELVDQLLDSKIDSFLIEITDNASTDGTVEMLKNYNNRRIVIHRNNKNVGGRVNILNAIFNCQSKYCLYLNDRDVVDISKFSLLKKFLNDHDLGFVHIPKGKCGESHIYKRGKEAIVNLGSKFHPSGMIYNTNLVHSKLKEENYLPLKLLDLYSAVATDLMMIAEGGILPIQLWTERPRKFLQKNKSGFMQSMIANEENLYFHPKAIIKDYEATLCHILVGNKLATFSEEEIQEIAISICNTFFMVFLSYKSGMASKIICSHYGIKTRFISTSEFKNWYNLVNQEMIKVIRKNNLPMEICIQWDDENKKRFHEVIIRSIKDDIKLPIKKLLGRG